VASQVLDSALGANDPRWDGASRGHYEVWYLTLSDPATGRGFWFRYTLEVPKDAARAPVAELWGFVFTPGRPAVGGKATAPVVWPPDGTMSVRLESTSGVLEEGNARGELPEVGLAWDLTWDPSPSAMWHIPGRIGRSKIPSTRVVSPTVNAVFRGSVSIGDETITLEGARGCQTHLWGRQHAARWAWGHCSAFRPDRPDRPDGADGADDDSGVRDDVLVEAVWAVPLLAPGRAAPGGPTFLYAEVGGESFACNALPWVAAARSRIEGHGWELRGRTADARVRAVLEATPAEMAQVTYEDPDGAHAWCANSEIARAVLEIDRGPRGGGVERFTSEGLAHVEFGARAPDPEVPVLC